MASEYRTRQKDLILAYLESNAANHVTVDQAYDYFKRHGLKVGRTTIYRYLEKMVQQGIVRKYYIEEGMGACYQFVEETGQCHIHYHLKCVECGCLIHLQCKDLEFLDSHLQKEHGFLVDHRKTVFYGFCQACRKKRGD